MRLREIQTDTEVDQMFGNDQEIEVKDIEELIANHEIDQLFGNSLEVAREITADAQRIDQLKVEEFAQAGQGCVEEVARDGQHGNGEVTPLPSKEAKDRWATWDTQSEFNVRKLSSNCRWYRADVAITIPSPKGRSHYP